MTPRQQIKSLSVTSDPITAGLSQETDAPPDDNRIAYADGDQREFDLETRVTTNRNRIISEMFHSCALNK